jgi:hypothetical protein
MTFRFGLLSVALSTLATLVAPAVRAQTSIELVWNAPPECPQEAAVRERLNALAGKPTQARRRLQALGHIEHVGKRYRLTLSVRERDSVKERTMNADSCDDLGGAAAVALGLLIRNERAAAAGEEPTSGTGAAAGQGSEAGSSSEAAGARDQNGTSGESAPRSAPLASAPSKKAPSENENAKRDEGEDEKASAGITSSEERPWRILLRAPVGAVALGRLPKPMGGVAFGVGASYREWRVNLAARVLGTQTIAADNAYEAGARVGHRDLALGICRDWREGRTALAPCVIAELQRETARGRGPGVKPQRSSSASLVVAAGVDAHLFVFDWLSLAATATLGLETSRPQLQVITAGDVKKLGPLELSFGLGPEWIF